jgi:hypothetical protein
MTELLKFHKSFYSKPQKSVQDAFLLKCCKIRKVKRRRVCQNKRIRRRDFNVQYRILNNQKEFVPVCQKVFLNTLKIKKYRVEFVTKHFYYVGEVATEHRGGNHKINKYNKQKHMVHQFILKLKCIESHYCRSAITERKYLNSGLSINKLYMMFKAETPQSTVKKSYFRAIFNRDFNLGFGNPRTDVCSKCIELDGKIKMETDLEKKNVLMIEKRVHKLRAQAFFKLLQEKAEDMITFSFDCQKNNPLPKVPDQSAYYSRQIYLYNFTIVQGSSKDHLNKDTTFAYLWTEDEFAKTSNQIVSAVFDRLNKTNFEGINTVRLMADGCGGQNKNSILLCMLSKWLLENIQVKKIEVIFPVTGHSFMPPDRVFGNIEKNLKKSEVIIHPQEYIDIIAQCATVTKMRDIQMLDFKEATKTVLKPTAKWPFKITQCKRFIIKRSKIAGNVLVRGEIYFNSDLNKAVNLCKAGMKINMVRPLAIPVGAPISHAKIADVDALLKKHFGNEWQANEECQFYVNIIRSPVIQDREDTQEDVCEAREEPSDLRI